LHNTKIFNHNKLLKTFFLHEMMIPQSGTIPVEDECLLTETIDTFFLEIINDICKNKQVKNGDLEIKSGEIAYHSQQVTNDRITFLQYKERVIGGVLMTRTEFNHINYTFFKNDKGEFP